MSRRDDVTTVLESGGWVIDRFAKSRKYRVLFHPDKQNKYYLGRSGAVRFGKNISQSISRTDNLNFKYLAEKAAAIRATI